MVTLLSLIFILGCIGIWYFIKKQPNKKYRNACIGIAIFSALLVGILNPSNSLNSEETPASSESSTQKSSIQESSTQEVDLELSLDSSEVTANTDKLATIEGQTSPGAKVTVGAGIFGDSTIADKKGRFTLTQQMTTDEKTLKINASLNDQTKTEEIKIKQNPEVIAQESSASASESAEKEKNSDITLLADEATSEQAVTLNDLAQQQFDQSYPYKGSKMHNALGLIQNWTQSDGRWYKKVEATIVNAFGAEQSVNLEIYITPASATSGTVEFVAY